MKKIVFIATVLMLLCFVFASCNNNVKPNIDIPEESSVSVIHNSTYDFEKGKEYIDNSITFANDKIKEFTFENAEVKNVENTPYDRFESYFDNKGNVKSFGYDHQDNVVFESYEICENNMQILYFEKTNGVISALIRTLDAGKVDFSFDNGLCTGYTLTQNILGMSSTDGAYKINYYNSQGYIRTDICDTNGNKISENNVNFPNGKNNTENMW